MGGGHYYAYIRPNGTMGFDYEAFAASGPGSSENNMSSTESKKGEEMKDSVTNEMERDIEKEREKEKDKEARNGQWFKFNDESVLKVGIIFCFIYENTSQSFSIRF